MTEHAVAPRLRDISPRRGRSRIVAGLTDQGLVALTSAGVGLLGTTVLNASDAGGMLLSIAVLFSVQGVARALVGETMLTHIPRFAGHETVRQTQNAHSFAAFFGLAGALLLVVFWWFRPSSSLDDLIWVAAVLPGALIQDACRYTYIAYRAQSSALFIDLCALVFQIALVTALIVTDTATSGSLISSLGAGALVGAAAFYARSRLAVWKGSWVEWIRDTHHLLGWFTACAFIAQFQTLVTAGLVTGVVSRSGYASLRLIQILLLQPVTNLSLAVSGLVVPTASRLAGNQDARELHRLVMKLGAAMAALGLIGLVIVTELSQPFLDWYSDGTYSSAAEIALPVWLSAWCFLLQVPLGVALVGLQRARLIFAFCIVLSAVSILGIWQGAIHAGLLGATYGLFAGASIALVAEAVMYLMAVRQLRPSVADSGVLAS